MSANYSDGCPYNFSNTDWNDMPCHRNRMTWDKGRLQYTHACPPSPVFVSAGKKEAKVLHHIIDIRSNIFSVNAAGITRTWEDVFHMCISTKG